MNDKQGLILFAGVIGVSLVVLCPRWVYYHPIFDHADVSLRAGIIIAVVLLGIWSLRSPRSSKNGENPRATLEGALKEYAENYRMRRRKLRNR